MEGPVQALLYIKELTKVENESEKSKANYERYGGAFHFGELLVNQTRAECTIKCTLRKIPFYSIFAFCSWLFLRATVHRACV